MLIAEPGRLGPFLLKNRIVMAPMGTNFSTTDGLSSERDRQYYEERAIGGVAMIMTEAMPVSPGGRNHRNSMCVFHDRFIPGLASVVESIKKHGAHVVGQLSHRGGLLRRSVLNMEPVGPSPWRNPNTGDEVRALSRAEIKAVQLEFVGAARRLMQAGYDAYEIHGANGYLFHQFFTPRVNRRTDEYGGSVENRMRFLLETIARIRDAVPDFPAIIRISATEYIPDGYPLEDVIALAQALERSGVVALDLSGGTNESPELSRYCIQPPSMPRRCLEPYASQVKRAVTIPVIVAGRIISPADAEAVLRNGSADFISLGRALYSDPHWCLKAFGHSDAPIRECISCNVCFERLTLEQDVSCVQNPMLGTEFESLRYAGVRIPGGDARRKVLVLGAGVAGAEAARAAAAQGHDVEIWERGPRAGGQIHLAVAAPDKEEVRPAWTYRWQQLQALGVPVSYGVDATEARIRGHAPDLVVVATGSKPRPLGFDFSGLAPEVARLHAWDVIAAPDLVPVGAQVAIIGGGMVGIELADMLIQRGCGIRIVDLAASVAPSMARNNRTDILLRLEEAGVVFHLGSTVEAARGRTLTVSGPRGATDIPAADAVIVAIGPQPVRDVVPAIERTGIPYVLAGDCLQAGDFMSAIRDGFLAGLSLRTRFRAAAPSLSPGLSTHSSSTGP